MLKTPILQFLAEELYLHPLFIYHHNLVEILLMFMAQEGSYFHKGNTLMTIESELVKSNRDVAIAEVYSAEEALKNSKVRYLNSNQIFDGMFHTFTNPMNQVFGNSNPAFDKFTNRIDQMTGVCQAESRLAQSKSKLKKAESHLQNTTIKAPFDVLLLKKQQILAIQFM